jgi:hypothetical protein
MSNLPEKDHSFDYLNIKAPSFFYGMVFTDVPSLIYSVTIEIIF